MAVYNKNMWCAYSDKTSAKNIYWSRWNGKSTSELRLTELIQKTKYVIECWGLGGLYVVLQSNNLVNSTLLLRWWVKHRVMCVDLRSMVSDRYYVTLKNVCVDVITRGGLPNIMLPEAGRYRALEFRFPFGELISHYRSHELWKCTHYCLFV